MTLFGQNPSKFQTKEKVNAGLNKPVQISLQHDQLWKHSLLRLYFRYFKRLYNNKMLSSERESLLINELEKLQKP